MERVFRQKPSPPAPLPVRGRGEPTGWPQVENWRSHADSGLDTRARSPSPALRERGWGEGYCGADMLGKANSHQTFSTALGMTPVASVRR